MKGYKTVLQSLHGVKALCLLSNEDGKCDLMIKRQRRIKSSNPKVPEPEVPEPKASEIPNDSEVIISEDGDFIYQDEGKFRTCMLTPNERTLVRAVVAAKDKKLDGNDAHKILGLKPGVGNGKPIRELVRLINRRLHKRKIPLRLSFADWYVVLLPDVEVFQQVAEDNP